MKHPFHRAAAAGRHTHTFSYSLGGQRSRISFTGSQSECQGDRVGSGGYGRERVPCLWHVRAACIVCPAPGPSSVFKATTVNSGHVVFCLKSPFFPLTRMLAIASRAHPGNPR